MFSFSPYETLYFFKTKILLGSDTDIATILTYAVICIYTIYTK